MPRFKDQAICIRHLEWSETSQVVVLLTAEHGKVRGLAKGSKRQSPSSVQRFSGGIELLTAGQVVATTKPTRELAAITEWDLQQDYFALRRNLRAQQTAMYAADLCHAMLPDLDPHASVFEALAALLNTIGVGVANDDEIDPALLRFQWAVLDACGYRPELKQDVRSGSELAKAKAYSFDPIAGGVSSEAGAAEWRVRASTVELLRGLGGEETIRSLATGLGGGAVAEAEIDVVHRANRLLCVYARAILGQELPTMGAVLRER